jgi:hypothetical protein
MPAPPARLDIWRLRQARNRSACRRAVSEAWGFESVTACDEHFVRSKGELTDKGPINDQTYLDDDARIKILFTETGTVTRCLQELATELSDLRDRVGDEPEIRAKHPGDGYLKLSAALARHET